jgi:predicted ABC-type sugar transport system permease subunit
VKRLRLAIAQNRGFVGACLMLAILYLVYHMMHPRGFSGAVLVQNANESVAIGFVAMAQTVPVLLGGLDLSVGAVMTLTNCIASELVNGSPAQIVFGMIATLACGAAFGLLNGLIVVYGRIQPIITTLATGAIATKPIATDSLAFCTSTADEKPRGCKRLYPSQRTASIRQAPTKPRFCARVRERPVTRRRRCSAPRRPAAPR